MRLIDADALKTRLELDKQIREGSFYAGIMSYIIDSTPTIDAVPVVRCKDCKWWDGRTWDEKGEPLYGYCNACKHGHYSSNWEISIFRKYKADWFCADGERKDT